VIDYETYVQIRNYFTNGGLNYSQIADELGLDPRTVAKWANEKRYIPRRTVRRKSKLDPFKNDIVRMLEKHPYTGTQIFQRLRQNGFDGVFWKS
jgi:Mn-dependent DtxR family transcriptional regulator